MKLAVVGVGAIGGLLAGRLLAAGHRPTLVDRGERAARLRADGLALREADGTRCVHDGLPVPEPEQLVPHDIVLLAVKAHEIPATLPLLASLLHGGSVVVTLQNGLPWWYFLHGTPPAAARFAGRTLESVDPEGRIAAAVPATSVVGGVAYPAADVESDGTVRLVEGNRFTLGEPDGSDSARLRELSALLAAAGFKAPTTGDIRAELWLKNWGNLCFNPISALTGATMGAIGREPATRALCERMMREAAEVAGGLGVGFRVSLERRLQGAIDVGEHRTSMLQDLERGRPLEHQALLGSVVELARLQQLPVPTLEAVLALVTLRDPAARALRAN